MDEIKYTLEGILNKLEHEWPQHQELQELIDLIQDAVDWIDSSSSGGGRGGS